MTDRLREKARELLVDWIGIEPDIKGKDIDCVVRFLLSARDEALEEAAEVADVAEKTFGDIGCVSERTLARAIADKTRSLKSKVTP